MKSILSRLTPGVERTTGPRLTSFTPLLIVLLTLLAGWRPLAAQLGDYAPPLRGPLLVTGTFGELRSDHYHAGLDFRAATGTPVYAVEAGYVSRIKISPGGYGQAIYVDHPDGYRSVYGHLSALRPDLIDTVRAVQLARQTFSLDLEFGPTDFPVERGDRLGRVGNRGYSFGPHLHFEVRSQVNDAALNPLNFGIRIADRRKPQLRKLKVYERTDDGRLMKEYILGVKRVSEGNYVLADTIVSSYGKVDFAIKAFDRQDAMPNYNGPYAMWLTRDSLVTYGLRFDSIPFEETRCLNAHVDYREWNEHTSWFHRLTSLPGVKHCYFEIPELGNLECGETTYPLPALKPGKTSTVTIAVADWSGNVSTLTAALRYDPARLDTRSDRPGKRKSLPPLSYQYLLPWAETSIIDNGRIRLQLPRGSLYETLEMRYQATGDSSANVLSEVHQLHDEFTPLHLTASLTIEVNRPIAAGLYDKVVVARCAKNGSIISYGGGLSKSGAAREVGIRSFGSYCLLLDTIPPTIEPINVRRPLHGSRRITFRITDNLETAGKARGLRYFARLNGEWVLMEYDLKKDLIYHDLQRSLSAGGEPFELRVADDRENVAVYRTILEE